MLSNSSQELYEMMYDMARMRWILSKSSHLLYNGRNIYFGEFIKCHMSQCNEMTVPVSLLLMQWLFHNPCHVRITIVQVLGETTHAGTVKSVFRTHLNIPYRVSLHHRCLFVACSGRCGSPVVVCWTSDQWVAGSNPLGGMFHH